MATSSDEPLFERIKLVEQRNENEHHGPPFMQQLPSGDVIVEGSRQVATAEDQAKWRDAGRTSSRYAFRSRDSGKTWSAAHSIRVGQVIDRETGVMYRLHPTGTPMQTDTGEPMTEAWMIQNWRKVREMGRRMVLSKSLDGGRHWLELDFTDRLYNYPGAGLAWFIGHGIQLQRGPYAGRLLIPGRTFGAEIPTIDTTEHNVLYHSDGLGTVYDDGLGPTSQIVGAHARNCVAFSDDHGETWHWGGHSQGYAGEACIVERSDGGVYMSNRNHDPRTLGFRSWSVSRDGGFTFSALGIDPTLIDPRCHASLARYNFPSQGEPGRILFLNPAVFNNTQQHGQRHHMTLRVSYDDGKTWPVSKVLWEGPAGYSDMIILDDGTILCGFEISESGFPRDEVMLCRLNLAWLEQGVAFQGF
jgi:sialidase-1